MSNYIFERCGEEFSHNIRNWMRVLSAYSGTDSYVRKTLIRHVSENKLEFEERMKRCVYLNYPRKITRTIVEFIFSKPPDRAGADSEVLDDLSRSMLNADQVFSLALLKRLLFGRCWLLIDMPSFSGTVDIETKRRDRIRPFVRALSPLEVPDWCYGADGKLLWVLVEETSEDKSDPSLPPVKVMRRRLWTRSGWTLYEKGEGDALRISHGEHNLGFVPVCEFAEKDILNLARDHWMFDVVKASEAILNAGSEIQTNVVKQMFGLLVVSQAFAQSGGVSVPGGMNPESLPGGSSREPETGNAAESFSHALSQSVSVWETPEEKGLTRYIAPAGVESEVILSYMTNLKESLYDVLRMAIQSSSKSASSAESKAWDNLNASQMFSFYALECEALEREVWRMMHAWDPSIPVPEVSYSKDFSITDLKTAADTLMNLSSFTISGDFRKAVYEKALVLLDKLDPLPPDQYRRILEGIRSLTIGETPDGMNDMQQR